jgi:ATP-dependent Lon protease
MALPTEVGVMTLPHTTLFPQAFLPLRIFELRYRRMLEDALQGHRMFAVALRRPDRSRETPAPVAGLGLIRASVGQADGTSNLILQGIARVELVEVAHYRPYRRYHIRPLASVIRDRAAVDTLTTRLLKIVKARLQQPAGAVNLSAPEAGGVASAWPSPFAHAKQVGVLAHVDQPEQIADLVSWTLLSRSDQRQALLETLDVETRLQRLLHFLLVESQQPRTPNSYE